MSNIANVTTKPGREHPLVTLPANEASMLRAELELMMYEDAYLKKIAGAAALLVSRLDRVALAGGAAMVAFALARLIDGMPDDMVTEAMNLFKSS